MSCGKQLEKRSVDYLQGIPCHEINSIFNKACGQNFKAAGGGFQMWHNFLNGLVLSNEIDVVLIELVLSGCKEDS